MLALRGSGSWGIRLFSIRLSSSLTDSPVETPFVSSTSRVIATDPGRYQRDACDERMTSPWLTSIRAEKRQPRISGPAAALAIGAFARRALLVEGARRSVRELRLARLRRCVAVRGRLARTRGGETGRARTGSPIGDACRTRRRAERGRRAVITRHAILILLTRLARHAERRTRVDELQ
jgi:hypothetical protein